MIGARTVSLPHLVRIKPGAIARVGIYLRREGHRSAAFFVSEGLPEGIVTAVTDGAAAEGVRLDGPSAVVDASFEHAVALFEALPADVGAVVGLGGGKALDVAKYVAFLARRPFFAVPTSLSNDGFASPQSSLTVRGRRRAFASHLPQAVVVDTEVCGRAPRPLFCSGVGDLVAKLTAVADWKRAFHHDGTPIDDLAALLSDATVMQFIAHPKDDPEGLRLLATALMLNGVSMELAGSSRPASGSEHLVSHALDVVAARPRLHGLQVGLATYLISRLQGGHHTARIATLFERTGVWETLRADPFSRDEWLRATTLAPTLKRGFHTVLADEDAPAAFATWIDTDPLLAGCFD